MLRSLYIQNYALIEKLDISFGAGFSVITGETGAGKSIILGAIGLLLGQRAEVKAIRQGASKCVIEARFDISAYGMEPFFEENELEYEEECILRREVYASGKSRAFINDTPASLVQMKELGEQLIDVHSQHQNLLLNKEGFQLNVLDILSHNDEQLSVYQSLYREWKQTQQDLADLIARAEQNKADEDYIRFQLEQLEEANLSAGEQEELEQETDTLSHAEEIKAGLFRVGQLLTSDEGGLLAGLKESLNTMLGLQKVYSPATELAERLESTYIELKDVCFGYGEREILNNINLQIKSNSSLAIVGASGSGKTTLCNLIARFWDVKKGEVLIGGHNVKDFTSESLLKNISMVFQKVYLFNDTIENNIKFGNPNATHDEVVEACKKACCHDFITSLSDGYDTVVGEGGSTLSGGEKQRISIARAILKDAPIIILDEATSSVDPENEHMLISAIKELTKNKTLISIAHRLSTVREADQIIVIDKGRIVQRGNHNELIGQDGVYKHFIEIKKQSIGWQI